MHYPSQKKCVMHHPSREKMRNVLPFPFETEELAFSMEQFRFPFLHSSLLPEEAR